MGRHKCPRESSRTSYKPAATAIFFWLVSLQDTSNVEAFHLGPSKHQSVSSRTLLLFDSATSSQENVCTPHQDVQQEGPVGFYVHIPYCRRRCRYCDFAIVPIGSLSSATAHQGFADMDRTYREAVVREIRLLSRSMSDTTVSLDSLYFGGGTPSLAPVETIRSVLSALLVESGRFVLKKDAEITMEMDPGTFTLEQLQQLRELGINRISLGVQSFDNSVLESLGRVHRRSDIDASLSMLRQVFGATPNYSMDLISGLPGVSLAQWVETLERATTVEPPPAHLSLYDLQIERGTVFGSWYDDGNDSELSLKSVGNNKHMPSLPSAEECAFMYKYASGYLRSKGYEHYEISSYALTHKRSRHNQIYWNPNGQWYAVGLAATSSIRGKRFPRPRAMADYLKWVQEMHESSDDVFAADWLPQGCAKDGAPEQERDYSLDAITDVIMTRLRTAEGLDLEWADRHCPGGSAAVLRGASLGMELGLAQTVQAEDGQRAGQFLKLTDPDGFLFSNSIISSIFVELGITE